MMFGRHKRQAGTGNTGQIGASPTGCYVLGVLISKTIATALVRLRDGDATGAIVAEWDAGVPEAIGHYPLGVWLRDGATLEVATAAAEATLIYQ